MSLWRWTEWLREQRLTLVCIALVLAGIPLVAVNGWIIGIVRDWIGFDVQRLTLLGQMARDNNLLLFIVLLSLGMVLSIRALKAGAGKDGVNLDVQGQDEDDDTVRQREAAAAALRRAGAATTDAGKALQGES